MMRQKRYDVLGDIVETTCMEVGDMIGQCRLDFGTDL